MFTYWFWGHVWVCVTPHQYQCNAAWLCAVCCASTSSIWAGPLWASPLQTQASPHSEIYSQLYITNTHHQDLKHKNNIYSEIRILYSQNCTQRTRKRETQKHLVVQSETTESSLNWWNLDKLDPNWVRTFVNGLKSSKAFPKHIWQT